MQDLNFGPSLFSALLKCFLPELEFPHSRTLLTSVPHSVGGALSDYDDGVVPILIIGFNRPEFLANLISIVRKVAPEKVYLAIDGPRQGNSNEFDQVVASRATAELLDWGCNVETLFHDENLGCGGAVTSALSWFFENEESGIILEDDLEPTLEFFKYCEVMLDRYRGDASVMSIAGSNFVPIDFFDPLTDYHFSRYPHVWGWATWRRTWNEYRFDISNWESEISYFKLWRASGMSLLTALYFAHTFNRIKKQNLDTWDAQLMLQALISGALTVTPNRNLVENQGFDSKTATHTNQVPLYLVPASADEHEYLAIEVDSHETADKWVNRNQYGGAVKTRVAKFCRQNARKVNRRNTRGGRPE